MSGTVSKPLSANQQEAIIKKACERANLGTHIKLITSKKEVATWAERIAIQYRKPRCVMPVKNSFMYCDTLDMCFFFLRGHTPAVAHAGYTTAFSKDAAGGLAHAFAKADEVLRYMVELKAWEEKQ